MNSRKILHLIRGYSILLLCLFIFTMWGINLFSISQTDEKVLVTENDGPELVEEGAATTRYLKPLPFLYYYFTELGYSIDFCKDVPSDRKLLLVIDPPQELDRTMFRDLFAWVRAGGNLVFFLPDNSGIDRYIGIERSLHEQELPEELQLRLPYLDEIETISSGRKAIHRQPGMSFFSVMPEQMGGCTVFMSFRGSGRMIVLAHADFLSGLGLKKRDNLVLVTRMVEHLAVGKHLSILDTFPSTPVQVRARRMVPRHRTYMARQKVDHISFWSLVKANPISWVLLQMVLALAVYFYSTGRRFGRAIVLADPDLRNVSYVRNLGKLLAERHNVSHALSEILYGFAAAAIKRYGLAPMAQFREIVVAIRAGNIEVADSLSRVELDIQRILNKNDDSPGVLLRVVRTLERARKELKLHD
ncbi:MAG: hypothetical protein CVV41_00515 [Candidatus Riflebacteria bacterium HGW-Riflebacteria-1]|jgi:hypothetical protein|nr:MAG: hypothetical protein CVV41_00515 [Candidatus Riflebacteria bacterium HGW-Riflebacteria-1]